MSAVVGPTAWHLEVERFWIIRQYLGVPHCETNPAVDAVIHDTLRLIDESRTPHVTFWDLIDRIRLRLGISILQ